ncbi:uncharacterized protein LOC125655265 isoform X2 [Ostrea edulis]|uniref:uncharacterized protein LOC125655265 isoform X2 n=1 Tax=Ostrea edulis TaxID=37623 RepID=UPI0024AFD05C|nr:uncharacterized protein LOC125655265 isoform X2 [Ostrea edulis]
MQETPCSLQCNVHCPYFDCRRKVSIGLRLICTKVAFLLDTFLNTMEEQSCTSFVETEELEAEQSFHPRRHAYGFRL